MAQELIAGRYRLEERLGMGAMAEVWEAHDEELDRRVAVKLLSPGADVARFDREARAAAGLAHPNIVRVYDVGTSGERRFIVQEFVSGGALEERLQPGERLSDDAAARIARDVAAGLAHAHSHGLVHLDEPLDAVVDPLQPRLERQAARSPPATVLEGRQPPVHLRDDGIPAGSRTGVDADDLHGRKVRGVSDDRVREEGGQWRKS